MSAPFPAHQRVYSFCKSLIIPDSLSLVSKFSKYLSTPHTGESFLIWRRFIALLGRSWRHYSTESVLSLSCARGPTLGVFPLLRKNPKLCKSRSHAAGKPIPQGFPPGIFGGCSALATPPSLRTAQKAPCEAFRASSPSAIQTGSLWRLDFLMHLSRYWLKQSLLWSLYKPEGGLPVWNN